MRHTTRLSRGFVLAMLALVAFASVAIASHDWRQSTTSPPMPSLFPDPCVDLMGGIADDRSPNRLAALGLRDSFPSSVLKAFSIASWTCLSERTRGTLDALMLRLKGANGEYSGVWILLPSNQSRSVAEWQAYAEATLNQPITMRAVPDGLVGGVDGPDGTALLAAAGRPEPSVSLWKELHVQASALHP